MKITHVAIFDFDEPLSKVMREITKTKDCVLVIKDKKYYGVIDDRAINVGIVDMSKEKCGSVAVKAPHLAHDADIKEACMAFFSGRFRSIPVIEDNKIYGVITRKALLEELIKSKALPKKSVAEVMSTPVVTLDGAATIGAAKTLMRKHNIRRLVVTEHNSMAGILSIFDLARALTQNMNKKFIGPYPEKFDSQLVHSFMIDDVETIGKGETITAAAGKMAKEDISSLVVAQNNLPEGIITTRDIFECVLHEEKISRVFVSGLLGRDKEEYASSIDSEGNRFLDKLQKSVPVEFLSMHIKKEGSEYSVRARLAAGRKLHFASALTWGLPEAVTAVIAELKKIMEKEKEMKKPW
jgi:CBS domain-containing protein